MSFPTVDARTRDTSPIVHAGITLPPSANQSGTLNAVLDVLLPLLASFDLPVRELIYTSEPRRYRLTKMGRDALTASFNSQCITYLTMIAGDSFWGPSANFTVHLRNYDESESAIVIEISGQATTPAKLQRLAALFADFVRDCFVRYHAAEGHVSVGEEYHVDTFMMPNDWEYVTRFALGVFWGNALGPDLCDLLGGRDQVLREAPGPVREPLGEGVWLQSDDTPPAGEDSIDRLKRFLEPLLGWSQDKRILKYGNVAWWELLSGASIPFAPVGDALPTFALRLLPDMAYEDEMLIVEARGGDDITYNLYFDRPPTDQERELIAAMLAIWANEERDRIDAYGWFHHRSEPAFNGSTCRWRIDTSCNGVQVRTVEALREWCAILLPRLRATELVLGTEVVG